MSLAEVEVTTILNFLEIDKKYGKISHLLKGIISLSLTFFLLELKLDLLVDINIIHQFHDSIIPRNNYS